MSTILLSVLNIIKFKIPGTITSTFSSRKKFSRLLFAVEEYLTYISPTIPTFTFFVFFI